MKNRDEKGRFIKGSKAAAKAGRKGGLMTQISPRKHVLTQEERLRGVSFDKSAADLEHEQEVISETREAMLEARNGKPFED